MLFNTLRFGTVEIDDNKLLSFADGIPGLEQLKQYAILQFDESYPIVWLQSTEDGNICLPVIDSFLAIPDYSFNLDDGDVKELEINGPEDLQVISVLVIPDNIERMTANLVAPIIINLRTGRAKQVILSNEEYNVRFPVFENICRLLREGDADAGAVEKD